MSIRTVRFAVLALVAVLAFPAMAEAARKPRPSAAVIKAALTDSWATEFSKSTGGTISLQFERIRLGKTRRARYDSRLIPWGTWITPVQAQFIQTINYSTDPGPVLTSPLLGPTQPVAQRTDVTRVVQEALFYKTRFGWRYVQRGARTQVISQT